MEIIKEISSNNHIVRAQLCNKHWNIIDPSAINFNIEDDILSDRGSLFAIKPLGADEVGQLPRQQPKGSAKV